MVTVFVDTSAFIALLDIDDARHSEARATLEWLRTSAKLVTTNYVEVEAVAVAERRLGRENAARLVDGLLPLMHVLWVDELLHSTAMAVYRGAIGAASLVDRVSFVAMRLNAIDTAFAFDTDFEREGFKLASALRQAEDRHQLHEAPVSYGASLAPDAVGVAEISARAGRSVNTVQSWRRRHDDFPKPLAELAAGPIWDWSTIEPWVNRRERRSRANPGLPGNS